MKPGVLNSKWEPTAQDHQLQKQQRTLAVASPDPAKVVLEKIGHSPENTYAALYELSGVPETTLWHRDHGRDSIQQRISIACQICKEPCTCYYASAFLHFPDSCDRS
jgi:hypothetical protein